MKDTLVYLAHLVQQVLKGHEGGLVKVLWEPLESQAKLGHLAPQEGMANLVHQASVT